MLNKESLKRTSFSQEELVYLKPKNWLNTSVPVPENIDQLLIWTSELAQYYYNFSIEHYREVEATENSNKDQSEERDLDYYRKRSFVANQTKDFYLNKLLDQGKAIVKGYIKHPIKEEVKYAVIHYNNYDFISFATDKITDKFPIHIIDFERKQPPRTLEEISENKEDFLLAVNEFIGIFRVQYKKTARYNKSIKEHNAVVNEIYVKIKNGDAEIIKIIEEKTKIEEITPIQTKELAPPKEEKPKPIISNKNGITVIKKRKFNLVKD
ncbi:hypothetical protein [Acinetobacter pollinis]|uniref:hypothetical protein n=1 Tax=Acinetobacter pollinis TaxID=2605270 RepID=UPI0018A320FC|nr:hypothetical protein [Acinetobacter pollinis]MBF7699266.1 hypothetical protein [Acinetobacter pollinis]